MLGIILEEPHISSPEIFVETREQFEERVVTSLMSQAERGLYKPPAEMPYHNSEHMHFVHDRVVEYCDYVEGHGKRPDRFALRLAAVLHDASFHEDLSLVNQRLLNAGRITKPLPSKEHYSAWLAEPLLESYGIEPKIIKKVQRLIKKTNVDYDPRTLDEKILVRADLDNISGPKKPFVMNTLKLVREAEILNGPKNPFERIAISYAVLNKYVSKDLCFGEFDKSIYERTFKRPALANIARIADNEIRSTVHHLGQRAIAALPSLSRAA